MSVTITEFLLARVAEDEEREGRKYQTNSRLLEGYTVSTDFITPGRVTLKPVSGGLPTVMTGREFRERFATPAPDKRVLAECAAKRAIIERIPKGSDEYRPDWFTGKSALYILAAVYSDHPDYLPEWAL